MKISYRILIINFAIVAVILGSSALAFYSIVYNVLSSQQSKYLLNSANDFIYAYRTQIQDIDDEFLYLVNNNFNNSIENSKNVDFVLESNGKSSDVVLRKFSKEVVQIPTKNFSLDDFLVENPFALIRSYKANDGSIYYYGRIISDGFLNNIAKKINAEVALVWNGSPAEVSNESLNQKYSFVLSNASKALENKNNFDVYSHGTESSDILATIYKPDLDFTKGKGFQFLIFNTLSEAADLRTNLKYFLIIIGFSGILLSLILTLLFTDKIRKQITQLSKATEVTKDGNFQNKIVIQTKDELGKLGAAFNTMLEQLQKNEKAKNEYSEFITLINQNPTLKEISEAALQKIIKTCGFTIGGLYAVEEGKILLASSYGLGKEISFDEKSNLFNAVIKNRESFEMYSPQEKLPVVSAGAIKLEIKYLLINPIIYNGKVIAILELGSFDKPTGEAKEYLSKIQEQLAIGLTNAFAFVQLENLVTELKQLNEDYQKQNIQIRKQNETLVDLHKKLKEKADELEIQKGKAEEATELKSHFLASMSHELRTPMNSILGLTELILEDNSLKGKNRERIEVVLKSGKRLMNLINDILDLSKIEAGKMDVHNEDVFLEELITEIENSITPLAQQKGIAFRTVRNINTKIVVNTDRGKIVQVIINLLGNAVKFTDTGFVELRISSLENKKLKFDVIDTGIGMSEEDQKIIFEEFRQIDGTTTRKYSGTGLGLAICKKIAALMTGSISVESEPGSGSIFSFIVPLNFIKLRDDGESPKVNVQTLIKNRKNPILVIDDDAEVRYTIGQYLISKGYDVVYAADGETGIEQAKKIQPFVITLDVMMPNKDGWTVLKELKQNPSTKDIPVILISIIGDKNLGYGLGAYEYFVKPITPDVLLSAFSKLENLAKKKIEKIVIVDDDEMEFEKFKIAFKNDKVRIDYIKESEIAFSKILETQPDLIILDLMMPNVDGITLSYKLKSNRETKHIPIIISTAKDLTEEERNSLNNIVEQISVKSNGHPLDVLKVVRDRIRLQEINSSSPGAAERTPEEIALEEKTGLSDEDENHNYRGEVLVVDDDPDTLFTISEIVQACNCKAILAKNGIECLKTLEMKLPDLILLDIMMPGMDGFQTISRIKQNEKWTHIPVFAVTAKAMLEDKEVIIRHGFDDYIPKPVNAGVMAFKIEKLFSKNKIR
ncbi:MAG: response regulator [Ignavibacteriaceae bacterium]